MADEYSLEIYIDGDPEFREDRSAAFPVPATGDLLLPMWRDAGGNSHPDYRFRVVRVEHIIWERRHTVQIYASRVPAP